MTKLEDGQKQSVSVLELHPSVNNQVFKHWGRTSGHGAVVTGPLEEVVAVLREEVLTAAKTEDVVISAAVEELLTAARAVDEVLPSHLGQKVFVVVMSTVEVVAVISSDVVPAVV